MENPTVLATADKLLYTVAVTVISDGNTRNDRANTILRAVREVKR